MRHVDSFLADGSANEIPPRTVLAVNARGSVGLADEHSAPQFSSTSVNDSTWVKLERWLCLLRRRVLHVLDRRYAVFTAETSLHGLVFHIQSTVCLPYAAAWQQKSYTA